MKKLYTYIVRYWYGYLFAVFSMVTAIVLDMLYPKITQQIVDDVIIGGKLELLTKLLVGIVIVGIGRSIFGYCKEFTFDVLASKIARICSPISSRCPWDILRTRTREN